MEVFILIIIFVLLFLFERWLFEIERKKRRDYYRNVYLKSDAW